MVSEAAKKKLPPNAHVIRQMTVSDAEAIIRNGVLVEYRDSNGIPRLEIFDRDTGDSIAEYVDDEGP
jgi:hypothetical protein